jgi:pilus assembly protein CpaB
MRVLATDQTTEQVKTEDGKTEVRAFRTVTLEVTPSSGEKVAVAQQIGELTLVLRSIADNQAELERAIAAGDLQIPDGASPEEEERILRTAMGQPVDKGTTFATGGDVSRFQTSTAPPRKGSKPEVTEAAPGVASAIDGAPRYTGPTVRVTRGQNTNEVPVGTQVSRNTAR